LNRTEKAVEFLHRMDGQFVTEKIHLFGRILGELHSRTDLKALFLYLINKFREDKLGGRLSTNSLIKTGLIESFFPLDDHNQMLVSDTLNYLFQISGPEVEALWDNHQEYLKCLFVLSTEKYGLTEEVILLVKMWLKYDSLKAPVVTYILKSYLNPLFIKTPLFDFLAYAKGNKYLQRKYYSSSLDDRPVSLSGSPPPIVKYSPKNSTSNSKKASLNISSEYNTKTTTTTTTNKTTISPTATTMKSDLFETRPARNKDPKKSFRKDKRVSEQFVIGKIEPKKLDRLNLSNPEKSPTKIMYSHRNEQLIIKMESGD